MNNKGIIIVFTLVAGLFLLAMYRLMALRYESGEIRPPYSTYRSDPLGSRVLFEALGRMPDVQVERNLKPLTELPPGSGTTLVFAGAAVSDDPERIIEAIETFAEEGGRLVIAFEPMLDRDAYLIDPVRRGSDDEEDEKEDEAPLLPFGRIVSIADRWDFAYAFEPLNTRDDNSLEPALAERVSPRDDLPGALEWHSGLVLEPGPEWSPVYIRDEVATVMERPWGQGSIVLTTDSYYLSNEAMFQERELGFVTWLLGRNSRVIFDERHLGIGENPGIAALARRYGLHGMAGAIFAITLLFIWRGMASLTPKRAGHEDLDTLSLGKDSAAGLTSLLRRSIPPSEILGACYAEWERNPGSRSSAARKSVDEVRTMVKQHDALPRRERKPADMYRRIVALMEERKRAS